MYIGAAGTIARFLPGALAVSGEGTWMIEASESMSKRPVSPMILAFVLIHRAICGAELYFTPMINTLTISIYATIFF